MTDLLTLAEAKAAIPTWQRFATLAQTETEADAEPRLERALRAAEGELRDYVRVEGPAELTPRLERYLTRILKYNLFDLKYAHEDYDTKPAAVRRYEAVTQTLAAIRDGTQPDPRDLAEETAEEETADVHVQSKRRRFDSWLTDPLADW